jgi:hypothetical protein
MPFHVFLSHSNSDKPAVEELARRLAKEGVQPWLDKWHLIPGDPWQPAIKRALTESESCAVFIGPSGFGPWQNEEMRAAIDQRVHDGSRRFRVIPVLLPGAERAERSSLPAFLLATTWVEFPDSIDDQAAFHQLVCGIRGIEPGTSPGQVIYEGQCPYRGLRVFDVDDAPFFFGREALVQWLLNGLRPAFESQPVNRFLAIVGASGSGKSSLARAGLVAALKRDAISGGGHCPIAICRPGPDPLESLAVALSRALNVAQSVMALDELVKAFQNNEKTLHLITRKSLPENAPEMRLVVVVDQFEEVFTLCRKEEFREALIRNLLYAAKVAQGQTVVVLTMRADFYGKCASNAELAAAFSDHHILVGAMTGEELRRAIESPARLMGCGFDAGLVDLLAQDVHRQSGALPLLQHALLELWNKREGRLLTVKGYHEIGRLEGALQRRADATLKAFSQDEQELARRIFLRLTQPGEGTEDTKRRASMQELLSLSEKSTIEEDIIQKLANASLLTTEGDLPTKNAFVEVAHEALIRSWPKLREWIEVDRAGLRTRIRLTESARDWRNSGRDPAYLYSGARLAESEEWSGSHPGELSFDEAEFLLRSGEAEQQRQVTELETARRLTVALRERAEEAEKREQEQKESAKKLEEAAKKLRVERAVAEEQGRIARAAADTAGRALSDSFFRTIGVSKTEVPPADEREAMWELSQLDEENAAVRDTLLKRWVGTAEAFMRGETRGGQGFRTAIGLNFKYHHLATRGADDLTHRLVAVLENPQTDYDHILSVGRTLARLVLKVQPQAAWGFAGRGAQRILATLENQREKDFDRASKLVGALAELAANMEPQAASKVLRRGAQHIFLAMENQREKDDFDSILKLGGALAELSANMEPQAAFEIARHLVAAIRNQREKNFKYLRTLGVALANLATKMEPQAVVEIAKSLEVGLEDPGEEDVDRMLILCSTLVDLATEMEPEAVAEVANGLTTALIRPRERELDRLRILGGILEDLATKMEPQGVAKIAKSLAATLENPQEKDADRISYLTIALENLAKKMKPQAVAEIAKSLESALKNPKEKHGDRLRILGRALRGLTAQLRPQAALEIAKRLSAALENPRDKNSNRVLSLGSGLQELTAGIEPQALSQVAERLAMALENPREKDYDRLLSLGHALAELASKIEPHAVVQIAKILSTTLENPQEKDYHRLRSLGRALADIVAKIEPQAATEIARRAAQHIAIALENPEEKDYNRLRGLGGAFADLATKIEPQTAAEIARRGAQHLATALENAEEKDSDRLRSLGSTLAAFCMLLPNARHTYLLAVSNLLLSPVPKKAARGEEKSNDRKLLVALCALLPPQDLAEVLKYPFCTGEAEQIVLSQLEQQTGLDFAGNVWNFVENANAVGIEDISRPARRPAAQDAVNELDKLLYALPIPDE